MPETGLSARRAALDHLYGVLWEKRLLTHHSAPDLPP